MYYIWWHDIDSCWWCIFILNEWFIWLSKNVLSLRRFIQSFNFQKFFLAGYFGPLLFAVGRRGQRLPTKPGIQSRHRRPGKCCQSRWIIQEQVMRLNTSLYSNFYPSNLKNVIILSSNWFRQSFIHSTLKSNILYHFIIHSCSAYMKI